MRCSCFQLFSICSPSKISIFPTMSIIFSNDFPYPCHISQLRCWRWQTSVRWPASPWPEESQVKPLKTNGIARFFLNMSSWKSSIHHVSISFPCFLPDFSRFSQVFLCQKGHFWPLPTWKATSHVEGHFPAPSPPLVPPSGRRDPQRGWPCEMDMQVMTCRWYVVISK